MSELVIGIAVMAALVAGAILWRRRRESNQPPPLGIVLLLSRAKPLDASGIAAIFGQVTGTGFEVIESRGVTAANLPKGNVVLGGPLSFLVQAGGDLFVVNSVGKPYAPDLQPAEADGVLVEKLRQEHQAWTSVEILHPEAVSAANYRIVAQVAAELLDADCLALFHPESRKLVPAQAAETESRLRDPHPITAVFGVSPGVI